MLCKKIISTVLLSTSLLGFAFIVSACVATPQRESTGQYIDSSTITAKVKTALIRDEGLAGLSIIVKTYKNVVQLSGFVDNAVQKERAVDIARNVSGVRAVKDSLIIK